MSHDLLALLGVVLLLVFMFLRMPIAVCMALVGFIGLCLIRGVPPALANIAFTTYRTATAYQLSMIPLFILMGELAFRGGLSKDAYSALYKWVGRLPGGLAMATVGACSAFGAVCGSHVATAATMCSAALPEMRKFKYSDELSLGCICAGGNLGIMIPPSSAFIIYGFVTETPVGALFIAGILPGIMITLLFWLLIYIRCNLNPQLGPRGSKSTWKEKLMSLDSIWKILVIFVLVIGGIYAGIFTPTESAAIGVFLVFVFSIIKRQLTWRGLLDSLLGTTKTSAMIFLLIIGSMIFSSFLTTTEVALGLSDIVDELEVGPYVILAAVLVIYFITGFFLEIYSVILITLPIFFPIIVISLGFDPLLFGVLTTLTVMIGAITPPVGNVVFVIAGKLKDVPMYSIFRGCLPFIVTMLIALIILIIFPQISLILPDLMIPYR